MRTQSQEPGENTFQQDFSSTRARMPSEQAGAAVDAVSRGHGAAVSHSISVESQMGESGVSARGVTGASGGIGGATAGRFSCVSSSATTATNSSSSSGFTLSPWLTIEVSAGVGAQAVPISSNAGAISGTDASVSGASLLNSSSLVELSESLPTVPVCESVFWGREESVVVVVVVLVPAALVVVVFVGGSSSSSVVCMVLMGATAIFCS